MELRTQSNFRVLNGTSLAGLSEMTSYKPADQVDRRLQFTGVLVAGDASDEIGEHLFPLGSGFFVAPHIVLTARHVIDEISEKFHGCKLHDISGDMKFGIDFDIQHSKHGLMKWSVMGYGYTPTIDVTALLVELRDPDRLPDNFEWDLPTLSFGQVLLGERIVALGYPQSSHQFDDAHGARIKIEPYESDGNITQVHKLKRDSIMLAYPCYETNARIEGGMSGGPVFDSRGNISGVIDSSFELTDDAESAISYISAIWPCTGIELRQTVDPIATSPTPYYLQALVDDGRISAVDRMTSVDQNGKVTIRIESEVGSGELK
jgi:trypsin-like peptidase